MPKFPRTIGHALKAYRGKAWNTAKYARRQKNPNLSGLNREAGIIDNAIRETFKKANVAKRKEWKLNSVAKKAIKEHIGVLSFWLDGDLTEYGRLVGQGKKKYKKTDRRNFGKSYEENVDSLKKTIKECQDAIEELEKFLQEHS